MHLWIFSSVSHKQWHPILTTLLLPEPPRSSPASSCRPEAGPELAALGLETARSETAKTVGFFAITVVD